MSSTATPAVPVVTAPATPVDATPSTTPAPAAPATVKVGNREFSVAELEAAVAASATVDQAMRDITAKEKTFESKVARLKDPASRRALLKEYGVDAVKAAEDDLIEHLEDEKRTPQERRLAELEAKEKAREEADKTAKADAEAKAQKKQTTELQSAYEATFLQAIEGAGLPRTPEIGIQLTQIVIDALDAGFDLSPAQAATILRGRVTEANRAVFEGMTVAQLKAALPAKAIEALIKDYTTGLRTATRAAPGATRSKAAVHLPREEAEPASSDWMSQVLGQRKR